MIASVQAQLRTVAGLKLVGGAADFERAQMGLTTMPAAFVIPARESAGDNAFGNQIVQQTVAATFTVALAVRNLADAEGAAALESLEPVRVAVRDALLNFVPEDCTDGCEYDSGELVAFANGVLWWADAYRTAYLLRSSQ